MKLLPADTTDGKIKMIVVEWSEALAHGKFAEALKLCPPDIPAWTESELKNTISGYGNSAFASEGRKITSLYELQDYQEVISKSIEVDRINLYGMSPKDYLGMVHYDNIPLDGQTSDLTALFNIKKYKSDMLFLEFHNVRVM